MAGEGDMVIALRSTLSPILQDILRQFGRNYLVRYTPDTTSVPVVNNGPLGSANKQKPANVLKEQTIYGAMFQKDITRDSTGVGSSGSGISIPAYELYVPYDQFNFSIPSYTIIDIDNGLEFAPFSDAQELGMVGLRVGWVINMKAPRARGM